MMGERRKTQPMEADSFGSCLRRARERRRLSLHDVASTTKIPRLTLERIEASDIADLPADVFVRGFIRSFARAVGADESEPLHGFERLLNARRDAALARSSTPVVDPEMVAAGAAADDEASMPRRGLGLAVFVIILLLIATITLSLLLRRPPQSGEGLSDATLKNASGAALDIAAI
jgi:cytoskeletal protein RodZ